MKNKAYWFIFALSVIAILYSSWIVGNQIYEQKQATLISFTLIHFVGYLFFMLMPVELLFAYYAVLDINLLLLLGLALITAILAEIIDFFIGYLVSDTVINKLIGKEKYRKFQHYIKKYGNAAIFIFHLFPLSSSVLALAAGMVKYRIRTFLTYAMLGLVLKYTIILIFFSKIF